MQFEVTYLFPGDENKEQQLEHVNCKDVKECRKRFSDKKEYINVKIEEIDEDSVMEDEDDFSDMFPNAESKQDLEEELEHSHSRMMDN